MSILLSFELVMIHRLCKVIKPVDVLVIRGQVSTFPRYRVFALGTRMIVLDDQEKRSTRVSVHDPFPACLCRYSLFLYATALR